MATETEGTGTVRATIIQCLAGLALIVLAFRIGDVSPSVIESPAGAPGVAQWTEAAAAVQRAVDRGDLREAVERWEAGYAAALATGGWEGLLTMGDAVRRIGAVSGARTAGEARARALYRTALVRARQAGAVEGVVRTASAFADLGDRAVAERALGIARTLVARTGVPHPETVVHTAFEHVEPK